MICTKIIYLTKVLKRIPIMNSHNTTIWWCSCYQIQQIMDTKRHNRRLQIRLESQKKQSPVITWWPKNRQIVDALSYHIHDSKGTIEKLGFSYVDVVIKHVKSCLKIESHDDIELGPALQEVEQTIRYWGG